VKQKITTIIAASLKRFGREFRLLPILVPSGDLSQSLIKVAFNPLKVSLELCNPYQHCKACLLFYNLAKAQTLTIAQEFSSIRFRNEELILGIECLLFINII